MFRSCLTHTKHAPKFQVENASCKLRSASYEVQATKWQIRSGKLQSEIKLQPVYKPGSVRHGFPHTRRPFLWDGYCYPPQAIYPDDNPKQAWTQAPCHPYSILLLVGFTMPLTLLLARCALTAPFHPYHFLGQALSKKSCDVLGAGPFKTKTYPNSLATFLGPGQAWRFVLCGTFPKVTLAGRYPAPFLRGARTFLSLAKAAARPTGRAA